MLTFWWYLFYYVLWFHIYLILFICPCLFLDFHGLIGGNTIHDFNKGIAIVSSFQVGTTLEVCYFLFSNFIYVHFLWLIYHSYNHEVPSQINNLTIKIEIYDIRRKFVTHVNTTFYIDKYIIE